MDTQIGTRPQIGALEIHQAYILASLNWLQQTRSFIKTRTKDATELKFNIVKHIIDVKLQEQEERIVAAEKKAKRQKILDLMAKKQDAELESKSYEELAKELEALS